MVFLAGAGLDFFDAAVSAAPYESVDASARSAAIRKIKSPYRQNEKGQAPKACPRNTNSYCTLFGSVPDRNAVVHSGFCARPPARITWNTTAWPGLSEF